jgi:hypothetical protein
MMMSPPCGVSVSGGSSSRLGTWNLGRLMMRVKDLCRAVLALAQAPAAHDRQSATEASPL